VLEPTTVFAETGRKVSVSLGQKTLRIRAAASLGVLKPMHCPP
jgi:hypothetical protein